MCSKRLIIKSAIFYVEMFKIYGRSLQCQTYSGQSLHLLRLKKTTKQRRKVCSCDDVLYLCLVDYFPIKACLQAPVHFSKYMSVNILPAGDGPSVYRTPRRRPSGQVLLINIPGCVSDWNGLGLVRRRDQTARENTDALRVFV